MLTNAVATRLGNVPGPPVPLATHDGASAIFASRLPGDADTPCVYVDSALSDVAEDTKTTRGRNVVIPIYVFASADDPDSADSIAEWVRDALDGRPVTDGQWKGWATSVDGPEPAPSNRNIAARRVRARLRVST